MLFHALVDGDSHLTTLSEKCDSLLSRLRVLLIVVTRDISVSIPDHVCGCVNVVSQASNNQSVEVWVPWSKDVKSDDFSLGKGRVPPD